MKEKLESVGEEFNIEILYRPDEVNAEIGELSVNFQSSGGITISINTVDVPENCRPVHTEDTKTSFAKAEENMKNFVEKYCDILRFENPTPLIFRDFTYSGESHISISVYDNSSDPLTSLLNYSFNGASVYMNDNVNISSVYNTNTPDNVIGMYPIIDEKTAFEKLLGGGYLTTVWVENYLPDGFTKKDVTFCGVKYRRTQDCQYWLPYYYYLIELNPEKTNIPENLKEYGVFYVSAVSPEYLT